MSDFFKFGTFMKYLKSKLLIIIIITLICFFIGGIYQYNNLNVTLNSYIAESENEPEKKLDRYYEISKTISIDVPSGLTQEELSYYTAFIIPRIASSVSATENFQIVYEKFIDTPLDYAKHVNDSYKDDYTKFRNSFAVSNASGNITFIILSQNEKLGEEYLTTYIDIALERAKENVGDFSYTNIANSSVLIDNEKEILNNEKAGSTINYLEVLKRALMFGGVSFVTVLIVFALWYICIDTIKGEESIYRRYNVNVLGNIALNRRNNEGIKYTCNSISGLVNTNNKTSFAVISLVKSNTNMKKCCKLISNIFDEFANKKVEVINFFGNKIKKDSENSNTVNFGINEAHSFINSNEFSNEFKKLYDRNDFLILHSNYSLNAIDLRKIQNISKDVIVLVRINHTRHEDLAYIFQVINNSEANLLGCVLYE